MSSAPRDLRIWPCRPPEPPLDLRMPPRVKYGDRDAAEWLGLIERATAADLPRHFERLRSCDRLGALTGAQATRIRAERRAGELLAAMEKNAGARGVGKSGVPVEHPTLDSFGIEKKQSSRWQKLAAVSDEKFEAAVEAA